VPKDEGLRTLARINLIIALAYHAGVPHHLIEGVVDWACMTVKYGRRDGR
jgi:hypothetical protein